MATKKILVDPLEFDIKNVTITEPDYNKQKYLVSYVQYTDPKTGETGTLQLKCTGRYRLVFKPNRYTPESKLYLQVDSQVNSMYPEKSFADKEHQSLYDAIKAIDDLCLKKAKANPELWMGEEDPQEKNFLKYRTSSIHPSAVKPNEKSRNKVPDGKYSDTLKFGMNFSKKDKTPLFKIFFKPNGKKFDPKNPKQQWTVSDLEQNQECSMIIESGGVWFGENRYGHSFKCNVVKVFEGNYKTQDQLAMELGGDDDDEEEDDEIEEEDNGAELLGDGDNEEDDVSDDEEEEEEEELSEPPAPPKQRE